MAYAVATHIELHRALMMVNQGGKAGGVEYAENALAQLPPDKRSLSLKLMMAEMTG